MAEARGVLVVGEVTQGQLSGTTKEVLAAGRTLAQQRGTELAVGLVGRALAPAAQEALQAGGERVYTVEDALLADGQVDLHLAALTELCRTVAPDIILLGRMPRGQSMAAMCWRGCSVWPHRRSPRCVRRRTRPYHLMPHVKATLWQSP